MLRYLCLALAVVVATPARAQEAGLADLESLLDAPVNAASQYLQTAREAPAAVTVISASEIEDFGYRTLAEVLQHVRGFYLNDDLETEYVGTRGFGRPGDFNTRVMVLVDGQAQNEAASGYIFLDQRLTLDMGQVKRVEVVRGPGSTLHGSGAMLAVVNVVTKDPSGRSGDSADILRSRHGRTEAGARFQRAFDSGLSLAAWGSAGHEPGRDLYFSSMDAPGNNQGVSAKQDWNEFRNIAFQGVYGGFRALVKGMSYNHGSPASIFGQDFNSDTTRTGYQGSAVELGYTAELGSAAQLHLVGSANSYARRQTIPLELAGNEFVARDKGRSQWYRGEAQLRLDTTPANRLFVGAQFKTASLDYRLRFGDDVVNETTLSFYSVSAYAQNEYRLSRQLAATFGVRYDYYRDSGGAFAPRFALVFNATQQSTLKLIYGSAFRAPNVEEAYSSSEHLNLVENPDLSPEYIHTVEGIWEQEWNSGLASTLSVYDYRMRGLIELSINDELAVMRYENVGRANARGVEVGLTARKSSGRYFASAAYQRARDGVDDEPLWSSPAFLAKAGASFPVGSMLRSGLQVRAESGRRTKRNVDTKPFAVVDLTMRTRPVLGQLTFALRVRNLLDARYELPGTPSHVQASLAQARRTVTLQATLGL